MNDRPGYEDGHSCQQQQQVVYYLQLQVVAFNEQQQGSNQGRCGSGVLNDCILCGVVLLVQLTEQEPRLQKMQFVPLPLGQVLEQHPVVGTLLIGQEHADTDPTILANGQQLSPDILPVGIGLLVLRG